MDIDSPYEDNNFRRRRRSPSLNGSAGLSGDGHLNGSAGRHDRESSFQSRDTNARPSKKARYDVFEPVAIIGLSLKFSQEADSVQGFWETLLKARSTMTKVPSDRWNTEAFRSEEPAQVNHFNVDGGHFVREDIARFDAPFFSINAMEAACMDPQQRALLESSYRALENAGITMRTAAKTKTSVYIGCSSREYEDLLMRDHEMEARYIGTGSHFSMLANRLSWFYDLSGPSLTLDTACSSSLLAVHLACQSLHTQNCKMAIVGGTNLIFNPDGMWPMANLKFLSPDSRCYSFDHRANGYGRGEGTGIIILKPLQDAIRDGNTIRAVIRGTGCNQDGYTPSITQPCGVAQENLIRETYNAAGLDLKHTRFFEAHGTGTVKGDPIEAKAIANVFGIHRSPEDPLYVGAVKTNIGHLEGASGIAGLIKSVLVLEAGVIPPNTNFERPNPSLDLQAWNLRLPLVPTRWPSGLRRASVNSFGFGGTNTHVILDDAYHFLEERGISGYQSTTVSPTVSYERPIASQSFRTAPRIHTPTSRLVILSAYDQKGLECLRTEYAEHLSKYSRDPHQQTTTYFEDLVHTLSEKRSFFPWRSFTVANGLEQLSAALSGSSFKSSQAIGGGNSIAFVFTGQGAQWRGMGRELMTYQVFARSVKDADDYLCRLGCTWSLLDILLASSDATDIDDPRICQPLCTVLQIALVDLLLSWEVTPVACIGHSSGEIAAAYSSNLITKDSAWRIAYHRGIVSTKAREIGALPGGMMAIAMAKEEWSVFKQEELPENCKVVIACYNSPKSLTLSGPRMELESLQPLLDRRGIFHRLLKIPISYHSPSMKQVAQEYTSLIGHVSAAQPSGMRQIPLFSTVTASVLSSKQATQVEYWVQNLVSPVRFTESLKSMVHTLPDLNLLLEVGPHSALRKPIQEITDSIGERNRVPYLPSLILNRNSQEMILTMAGELFSRGHEIDFAAINSAQKEDWSRCTLTDLPEYPFNHSSRYWLESRLSKEYRFRQTPVHPLLGTQSLGSTSLMPSWTNFLRQSDLKWTQDHKINHSVIYPAGGMLVMAIEAIRVVMSDSQDIIGFRLRDVRIMKAMQIPESGEGLETNFTLNRQLDSTGQSGVVWYEFSLSSCDSGLWSENCRGKIMAETSSALAVDSVSRKKSHEAMLKNFWTLLASCDRSARTSTMYTKWKALGFAFGPTFQTLKSVRYDGRGTAIATVKVDSELATSSRHFVHPVSLDSLFQSVLPAISAGGTVRVPTFVPTAVSEMWISGNKNHMTETASWEVSAVRKSLGLRDVVSDITACSLDGSEVYAWVRGVEATAINLLVATEQKASRVCYKLQWLPDLDILNDNNSIARYCAPMKALIPNGHAQVGDVELASFIYLFRLSRADLLSYTKPHFARYCDWARRQLQRIEIEPNLNEQLVQSGVLKSFDKQQEILSRLAKGHPDAQLCHRIGENLQDLIAGRKDAIDLLFQDSLLNDFYLWCLTAHSRFDRLGKYLDLAAHKNPSMHILEIGAGTGSGTIPAMQVLSSSTSGVARFAQYTFTDISPSFFEKAQERLTHGLGRMTFKTLDISKDPMKQGFVSASFDMVLAVNVLHATANIPETLQNVRRLLKTGGKLVLVENCDTTGIKTGFVFGVLPDWWLGSGGSLKWGALLSETDWTCALAQNGFSGMDLCLRDTDSAQDHISNILVATAVDSSTCVEHRFNSSRENTVAILNLPDLNQQDEFGSALSRAITSNLGNKCDLAAIGEILPHRYVVCILDLDHPIFGEPSEALWASLQSLCTRNKRILWITQSACSEQVSPAYSMVTGWARCIRTEVPGLRLITMALEYAVPSIDVLTNITNALQTLFTDKTDKIEEEYVERNGLFYTPRIMPNLRMDKQIQPDCTEAEPELLVANSLTSEALKLVVSASATLNSLQFVHTEECLTSIGLDEVEVQIAAAGIGARDAGILQGKRSLGEDQIGIEGAGTVKRLHPSYSGDLRIGDRVFGFFNGAVRTSARTKASLIAPIPIDLEFAVAASMPVAYCVAFYALFDIAQFHNDQTLLVHYDQTGIGEAIIQLTQNKRKRIFVTVDSQDTREMLVRRHQIPTDDILAAQDPFLDESIQSITANHGVDICINSYTGEIACRSLSCVAPFGHFVNVRSGTDFPTTGLPLKGTSKSITISFVDPYLMMREAPRRLGKMLTAVVNLLYHDEIRPNVEAVFGFSELESAVQHRGSKAVVELRLDEKLLVLPKPQLPYRLDASSTYLIAGLGGLGRSMSRWLVARGAKNLLLLSRSGSNATTNRKLIEELQSQGVLVQAPKCDVSDSTSLSQVLHDMRTKMPPIKGCIQGAMVLKDTLFENMTIDNFKAATRSKVEGSWNLHRLLPTGLDFFILLSSLNGIIPFSGQSNYAAGNTFQDALAAHRISLGQKAVAIDLGIMGDVGYVAEHEGLLSAAAQAYGTISEPSFHALLEHYCNPGLPILSQQDCQVLIGITPAETIRNRSGEDPHWMSRSICRALCNIPADEDEDSEDKNDINGAPQDRQVKTADTQALLAAAAATDQEHIFLDALTRKLSRTLSIPAEDFDRYRSMNSYGTDSLVAVEVKNWIYTEFSVEMAIFEILDNTNLKEFSRVLLQRWMTANQDKQ